MSFVPVAQCDENIFKKVSAMTEPMVLGFAIAAGFVAGGVIQSFYQLVTNRPCRFELESEDMLRGVATIVLWMFTGPVILMRNALRGRWLEGRHIGWLFASTCIAAGWSCCSGILVLKVYLAIALA